MNKSNIIDFLSHKKIEIPMIQRDYAQGRISQKIIAEDFVKEILLVLSGKKANLHIDFIYGYQNKNKFILIDGQQRITTLWLVTVLFYKLFDEIEEIKDIVSNFSYNTRKSAKEFCKNLITDYKLVKEKTPKEQIFSNPIIKTVDLRNDPTVKSMLNMLDIIYNIYIQDYVEDINCDIYKKNIKNITFSLFNMGDYLLGEELYIKMNARGKQLSPYENIKAFIEEDMKNDHEILVNIDREWSDFFFDVKSKEYFDERGYVCIATITTFLHYIEKQDLYERNKFSELRSKIKTRKIDKEFFTILRNKNHIQLVTEFIALLGDDEYKNSLSDLNIMKYQLKAESFNKELPNIEFAFMYGILFYLKNILEVKKETNLEKQFNQQIFTDYYRICKHLILNDRMDEDGAVLNVIKKIGIVSNCLVDVLNSNSNNSIYDYLSKQESKDRILNCEIIKASLIVESRNNGDNWESILNILSNNSFYIGWIDFIINYCKQNDKYNFKLFCQYANICIELSEKIFCEDEKIDINVLKLFLRALLSVGDYGFYSTNWFYGNIIRLNIFRDREAWIWILSGTKENIGVNTIFKQMMDILIENNLSVTEEAFLYIINRKSYTDREWWEQCLIKQNELWEQDILLKAESFQKSGRIRFTYDEDNIINKAELLPTIKNRMRAKDLLTYSFYIYLQKEGVESISYYEDKEQKGYESDFSPSFYIGKHKVICNSIEGIIQIGKNKYDIDIYNACIFDEYNRIFKEYQKNNN